VKVNTTHIQAEGAYREREVGVRSHILTCGASGPWHSVSSSRSSAATDRGHASGKLGHFRRRVSLLCRPNQDVPFGQKRIAFESGFKLSHRLFGNRNPFLVDRAGQFNDGVETFPGHTFRPGQHGADIHELGTVPMLLQDTPAALDRIVFAMVGRVVQQLDNLTGVVGEIHHAFKKLGAHPAAFRTIVDFELDVSDRGLLGHGDVVPPVSETVHDEIAGLEGAAKRQVSPSTVLIHHPERDVFFFAAHIVVRGPVVATGFPPARVLADLHRGFAVDAQAFDLPLLIVVSWREGLAILFGEVGKDGIRLREFFWGLALTTLRRR
jgi:hypothetical protein